MVHANWHTQHSQKKGDCKNYTMHFVEFLIPHLANVNVTDRAGRTSLHHAAFNGHVEVKWKACL